MTLLRRLTSFFATGIDRGIDRFVAHNRRFRALTLREARRRRRALALCEARVVRSPEGSIDAVASQLSVDQHRRALDAFEGDARFAAFLLRLPVVRSHRRRRRPAGLAPTTRE
jgi:hypothetical protein